MTVEEAVKIVEQVLGQTRLTKVQDLVFRQSWGGQSYSNIAKESDYDPGYIKDIGFKLWKALSVALDEKVTKFNVQAVLERYQQASYHPQLKQAFNCSAIPDADWGEAIDVSNFCGREPELEVLKQWVLTDRCHLISILGMGGIGKTSLSVKLAEQVQSGFEFVIWRSLRDAPLLSELLTMLLQFFSKQQAESWPETERGKLARLMDYLQKSRCLLVLDNFDALFVSGQRVGVYRDGYAGYGELLQRIGEIRHNSCLILTSRDKPLETASLQGESFPVRELQLHGLRPHAAYKLLSAKGLNGSEEEVNHLVKSYQGNPLALRITATFIQNLFDGNVADFLSQGVVVFTGIRQLLKQQIDRLSEQEQAVMYWLAIDREPVSMAELQSDLLPLRSTSVLLETLESLRGRSLIERTTEGFTQQPVMMEYITDQLVEQAYTELIQPIQASQSQSFLSHYALMKVTAKDYIRESQIRIIVKALVNRAIAHFGSKQKLFDQLSQRLSQLKTEPASASGYAVDNIINLLNYLQVELADSDFSHLQNDKE